MTDLKDFIEELIRTYSNSPKANKQSIIAFMEDNQWFGARPKYENGKVTISQEQIELYSAPLVVFLTTEANRETLHVMLSEKYQTTASYFERFRLEISLSDDQAFYVLDFLLAFLKKDLCEYSDSEATDLVHTAAMELTKACGDILTFFMAWLRTKTKTKYFSDYVMQKRYTMEYLNQAYSLDEYLALCYYLFNEDYIVENEMYLKAAQSQIFTDAWLYLCMHYICALRLTDLQRIYHPDLMYPPSEIIEQIANDTFSDCDALKILLSITERLAVLPFTPSKTSRFSGVSSVHFDIPHSCQVHFGKLFALAEAHRQLNGCSDDPIIRKVSTYEEITRTLGDEIGTLFLHNDFRSRSATKSYLQLIFMAADDALEHKKATVKGYVLAAMARSHKGTYGSFAQTTIEYLKDMHLSGYDAHFVAFELLERGVLSFIPAMILNLVTNGEYEKIDVQSQTKLLKEFGLSPFEVNSTVETIMTAKQQAEKALQIALQSGEDLLSVCHHIASGQAFSKSADCLCLYTACGITCPYDGRTQCIGCEAEISTKSTLFLLISEYRRMHDLYKTTGDPIESAKYQHLAKKIIIPKMHEILHCLENQYGRACSEQYRDLIKKYIER